MEGKSLREFLWDMQRDKMLAVVKADAYSDKDADAVRVMLSSIIKSPHVFELAEFMFWRQRYLFPDRYDRAERTRELAKRRLNEF
jgi:alanine racemase